MRNFHWNSNYERAVFVDLSKNHVTNFTIVSSDSYVTKTKFVLCDNSLTSIEFTLKNLRADDDYTFFLDNNPFNCDLKLHNLFLTAEKNPQVTFEFKNANCSLPAMMKNRMLRDLTRKDLKCNVVGFFSICSCFFDEDRKYLEIDCSGSKFKSPPDFTRDVITQKTDLIFDQILLNISHNKLGSLPDISRERKLSITKIDAVNNSIADLRINNLNSRLKCLDLRNNSMKHISHDVIQALGKLQQVMLSGNPWICDCTNLDFFTNLKTIKNVIKDYDEVHCSNLNKKFADLTPREVCFDWPLVAACGIVLGAFGVFLSLFYKFKKSIKIFLYAHDMCLWFVNEEELDEDKNYDVFVCFASADKRLVNDIITELESDQVTCLVGTRDWPPSHSIPELVNQLICLFFYKYLSFCFLDFKLHRTVSSNNYLLITELPQLSLVSS